MSGNRFILETPDQRNDDRLHQKHVHVIRAAKRWNQTGKLHFVPPFHSELRTEEKIQGVRNENTGCSGCKLQGVRKGGTRRPAPNQTMLHHSSRMLH
jgi:hypothetical protein